MPVTCSNSPALLTQTATIHINALLEVQVYEVRCAFNNTMLDFTFPLAFTIISFITPNERKDSFHV